MTPTPVPTITPVPGGQTAVNAAGLEPWMTFAIVILALVALMVSLWLVYNYINNIRTTAIHRTMLHDAVFQARYNALRQQIWDYSPEAYPDFDYGTSANELESQRAQISYEISEHEHRLDELKSGTPSVDSSKEIRELEWKISGLRRTLETEYSEAKIKERRDVETARENKRKEDDERREKERERRDAMIKEQAKGEADYLVPPSLTVAGMGITGSFFIELTAILTIIFGIIILGLVGILATEQIAPILAAISGYVLGKTTSGWAPYGQPSSTPSVQSPTQVQIPSPSSGPEKPS